MGFYLVKYSINEENRYIYPESVAGKIWKSAVYHHTDRIMVGETEDKVQADGEQVKELKREEAEKSIKEFMASYPKHKEHVGKFVHP